MSADYTGPSEELILSSVSQSLASWAEVLSDEIGVEHMRRDDIAEHFANLRDPSPESDDPRRQYVVQHPSNCNCMSIFPDESTGT